MICFHFSIFEPLETAKEFLFRMLVGLWFAFILVSLNHWKQRIDIKQMAKKVVICFHFSIFEPLETAEVVVLGRNALLWFAFILVSLNHWKQRDKNVIFAYVVVICFHFSIFEPLETALCKVFSFTVWLWFAFILVSLNHWKQLIKYGISFSLVVICFHFSIFEPLETAR